MKDSEIEIDPIDEVTLVGYKWLREHGYGSSPTIWRKVKAGKFPGSIEDGKWTLAQIKRHILKQMELNGKIK